MTHQTISVVPQMTRTSPGAFAPATVASAHASAVPAIWTAPLIRPTSTSAAATIGSWSTEMPSAPSSSASQSPFHSGARANAVPWSMTAVPPSAAAATAGAVQ